jgi:hypothetical protein
MVLHDMQTEILVGDNKFEPNVIIMLLGMYKLKQEGQETLHEEYQMEFVSVS